MTTVRPHAQRAVWSWRSRTAWRRCGWRSALRLSTTSTRTLAPHAHVVCSLLVIDIDEPLSLGIPVALVHGPGHRVDRIDREDPLVDEQVVRDRTVPGRAVAIVHGERRPPTAGVVEVRQQLLRRERLAEVVERSERALLVVMRWIGL